MVKKRQPSRTAGLSVGLFSGSVSKEFDKKGHKSRKFTNYHTFELQYDVKCYRILSESIILGGGGGDWASFNDCVCYWFTWFESNPSEPNGSTPNSKASTQNKLVESLNDWNLVWQLAQNRLVGCKWYAFCDLLLDINRKHK